MRISMVYAYPLFVIFVSRQPPISFGHIGDLYHFDFKISRIAFLKPTPNPSKERNAASKAGLFPSLEGLGVGNSSGFQIQLVLQSVAFGFQVGAQNQTPRPAAAFHPSKYAYF